ncbi:MAG: OmpA family protein [Pseudomonadota bacterium]
MRKVLLATLISLLPIVSQADPFARGWVLENDASKLQFQSIKNASKVEISSFATFAGTIDETGAAEISVLLDSVDTQVDLRNVRMRFLFFETFQYPEAKIALKIDPADLSDLKTVRRKTLNVPYTLDLHGVSQALEADVSVTLIADDLVAVSTASPITLQVADFNLTEGLEKLQDAANVQIVPTGTVTFDFIFKRNGEGAEPVQLASLEAPASAALEAEGDFSREACIGRFEILSRTGNIYFASGSANLRAESDALLGTLHDVVARCPDLIIQISGHTDSQGAGAYNLRLSEQRAAAVADWLRQKGIASGRMIARGYGEDQPVASNATPEGRGKNRRIEFAVSGS